MAKHEKDEQNTEQHSEETKDIRLETPQEQETHEAQSHASEDGHTNQSPLKRLWYWTLAHKKFSIPIAVAVLLAALAAVPLTRYLLAGTVLQQSFPVVVLDAESGKPVSEATIRLAGKQATTDNEGRAEIRTNVGRAKLEISKNHYQSAPYDVLVPIKKPAAPFEAKIKATGRQVPVTVLNTISKQPVTNATVAGADTEVKTGKDGKAVLVVPADQQELEVTITGEGFNKTSATLIVTTEEVEANTFTLTPSGKIYFLSNASGKIDVVKSNLDGADRQVVLAGTGQEERYNTVLLASRNWKYIALISKRDGGKHAKLFVIDTTAGDKLITADEGDAEFGIVGWSGDRLVYTVTRDKQVWETKRQAIKSYHAPSNKLTTLDETTATGTQNNSHYDYYGSVYVIDETILYVKNWGTRFYSEAHTLQNKQITFNSVRADGSQKSVVKGYVDPAPISSGYPFDRAIQTALGEFGEIYILHPGSGQAAIDTYKDGKVTASGLSVDEFYNAGYPRYAVSPSGQKTAWNVYRDGKNLLFVGNSRGEDEKELGRSDEHVVYGWFTDDYVLLTKKNSEMHIVPAANHNNDLGQSFKITDYYKPGYYNNGFGYGYGG